jgi:EmrB/QacA subfamily drug resistance transporter
MDPQWLAAREVGVTAAVHEQIGWGQARGRWVLTAAVLGSGVTMLDATVVNIALPVIGRDLDADFGALQWTVNGYTLTLASLILLGGSLGDRFGRRRIFVVGVVWFAVASVLCGVAQSADQLVVARMVQGAGGALLTPGSLALISASFREDDRARAIGAWSGLGGIAGAIGPLVGGLLVETSWRLVFLINVPLCAVVAFIALRHVPESRDEQMDPRLDVAGAVIGAVALAGTTYALIAAGEAGLSTAVVVAGVVGLVGIALFVIAERVSSHPMVPVEIFASRQFTGANLVTFVVYGALGGVFFLLVVHLQVVAGFIPLAAGAALLPVTACLLLLSVRAGALAQRYGARPLMALGTMVCAAGVLMMVRIGPDASYLLDVLPAVAVFGLGLSGVVAPVTATVLSAASSRFAGVASGINNAVARAAALLAVAVLPLLGGLTGEVYRDPVAFAAGFRVAMFLCAGLLVLGAVLTVLLIRDREVVHPAVRPPSCAVDCPPAETVRLATRAAR